MHLTVNIVNWTILDGLLILGSAVRNRRKNIMLVPKHKLKNMIQERQKIMNKPSDILLTGIIDQLFYDYYGGKSMGKDR